MILWQVAQARASPCQSKPRKTGAPQAKRGAPLSLFIMTSSNKVTLRNSQLETAEARRQRIQRLMVRVREEKAREEKLSREDCDEVLRGYPLRRDVRRPVIKINDKISEFTEMPQYKSPKRDMSPDKPHKARPWGYKGPQTHREGYPA